MGVHVGPGGQEANPSANPTHSATCSGPRAAYLPRASRPRTLIRTAVNVLDVKNLRKSFGTRVVLDGATFAVGAGEKVGVIGVNGSGKSTLLRIVAGEEGPGEGSLALQRGARVGYLAQEPVFAPGTTIRAAAAAGNPELHRALAEYHEVAARLEGDATADDQVRRLGDLAARVEALGGWEWEHRVENVLTRLGVQGFDRPVEGLSGGERKRVALARVLLDAPDLLLLDEPTNHLDADTTLWLEEHLLDYAGAVLLITHDRYFLDRVVTRMLEVEGGRVTSYPGGYTEYLEQKSARTERLNVEQAKRAKLIEQELEWVKRSPPARTGKQQARIRRLGTLEAEHRDAAPPSRDEAEIRFGAPPRLGRTVLELDDVSKRFGDLVLVRDLSTRLRAGERVGVIGPNGAGKTTLMRMILGDESVDAGAIRTGENTRIAYFEQSRGDLDPEASLYESVADSEWVVLGDQRIHVRSYLDRFLFPPAIQEQKVRSLSGGERSRLLLARLFLLQANLLVLDEPTNDLDLVTLQVLESMLVEFPGCVLMVTHDRFFLDKIATRLLVFEGDGAVHAHEGGYDLYRRLREQRESARVQEERRTRASAPAPKRAAPASGPRRLSYRETKELEGIEARILGAEARRDELGAALSAPDLYAETPEEVARVSAAFRHAEQEVEALYARWAELDAVKRGD
jgi:ABC transport system ATP-binding/permease protein